MTIIINFDFSINFAVKFSGNGDFNVVLPFIFLSNYRKRFQIYQK